MSCQQLFGCPVARVTLDETVEWALAVCRDPAMPPRARLVLPVNATVFSWMSGRPAMKRAAARADRIIADGMSVVWSMWLLGAPLPERVTGVDLMHRLLERGGRQRVRVYFLGATDQVLEQLVALCRLRHPDVVITGYRNGYFAHEEESRVVAAVRAARADVLFIGMPTPQKEELAHAELDRLGVRLVLPVGGGFDVLCGRVARAPALLQRVGLEWAWRALREPRVYGVRSIRVNSSYIALFALEWLRRWRLPRR